MDLRVRALRAAEFEAYRQRRVRDYAQSQIRNGDWSAEEADARADRAFRELLPDGVRTAGALILAGEREDGTVVGFAWLSLESESPGTAWLNSVEVLAEHRGRGYGRGLLGCVEDALRHRGVEQIEFSVLASNEAGRGLFQAAGYDARAIHMRKRLTEL
jgi:ribosomal protein S18 acetylase RimI-like enzyme